MMTTRRRSKAAAAAATEPLESISSHVTRENSLVPTTMTFTLPEDVDSETLQKLLPDTNLTMLSVDTVVSMYRTLLSQIADNELTRLELEETRAEIERKDVELDQALQDRESATKELEINLESVQNELSQVKQEKEELAISRSALQVQISTLSSSQSSSSAEVDALKHRVEETEREKRDLIGVVSRLKEDSTQRDEEIQNLRANLKESRQEHQALESQLRELRSTETSTKFKLDSLSQQLQLARDEAERASAELSTKSDEFAKYRRAKHAEFAQLQATHDSLAQTHAATESSLKALQSSYTAQSHQLSQALKRVQDLTGQLAEQEATYSSEAAGLRRLVEMMEEREVQAKAIVDGIEKEWAGVGERAERREAALRDEANSQRQRAENAEKKVAKLEQVFERMDRGEFPVPPAGSPGTPARGPSTPVRNGTPDFLTQGMMGLSPTVAMASRTQRSGKTFTEVYADYVRLQDDYARKSAEYDHMDRTLSAVLAQIEERAPVLSQQRAEYERLQSEAAQLASQLSQALNERDAHASAAQETGQKLDKSTRENDLLQKQLNDLGRQIQVLLKELGRRQDPSIPSDEELDQDETLKPAENIEAVITNHLVLFRSIPGLQEQNQKLLKIVRELGAKMEAEEKEYKETLDIEQSEAVREAHEAIKQLQEQLESHKKSSEVTIQAYMKERDALKSMLTRERTSGSNVYGQLNGHTEVDADIAKELAEVQGQFEAYRTEMGIDSVRLRDEASAAQREAAQLGAALAKANAKIEFLNDRHRMVQEQTMMQSRELDNLATRNQKLYDHSTRLDIECNRVTEDLRSANSLVEQLRNECANLRAEKKIWESVQARLVEDNKTLSVERSHLSDLMANVQRMHGDLERSGENDRRRLENQLQIMENQAQDLRSQLNQERESLRHTTLQRDIELQELRKRIDKTTQDLSVAREALVGAETSKKHLEERVTDLARQLQGNEEKLAVYERRSNGVNSIFQHVNDDMSHEQQLEAEVAELRSALKVAQVDLSAARGHVQQFQEISQANETALATLNATYDEFRNFTEAQIARHESEYKALQDKVQAVQNEFDAMSEKNAQLQALFDRERAAWADDKRVLEDTIVDLSTSEKSSENDRTSRETDIRQLEERAKSAEEKYAHEVLAHAESIKMVDNVKQQLSQALSNARDHLAAAETAQAKLTTSEFSWKQQREALDKELSDLNIRCKDLASQNALLHQHLESVSSQAARIKQAAESSSELPSGDGEANSDSENKLAELRAVVAYLRKEKEIVDLQLDLSKQENTRFKTHIDHLSQNLEDTRRMLSEERERAVEAAASESQHAELVERINQLTILRESNATLRADCEAHAKRARELDQKLQQASSELNPAKEQLRILQAELEAKEHQVVRLEEENRKWKDRNSQLLSKYDRIDPAEVQSLKDEIEQLKESKAEGEKMLSERDQQVTSQADRIANLEASLQKHKGIGIKNNTIYRTRWARYEEEIAAFKVTITELEAKLHTVETERDELKAKTSSSDAAASSAEEELSQQLEKLRTEKADLEKSLSEERTSKATQAGLIVSLQEERDKLLASNGLSATNEQWESEKISLVTARDEAASQAKIATEKADQTAAEIQTLLLSNNQLKEHISQLTKTRAADADRAAAEQQTAVTEAVEKLRHELLNSPPASADDVINRHADEMRALEERLTLQHQEELRAAVNAARKENAASAASPDQKAAIEAAVIARERQLKESHEQEITAAVERGRMEQAAKAKLKDSQLVRSQAKLKEYEAQIMEWQKAGLIPAQPAAGASKPPVASSSTSAAKPGPTSATTSAPPLRKPSLSQNAPSAPAEGAGRGRGAPRGGRGAGRGQHTRGAAPAGPAGGVSIMGAAKQAAAATPGVSIMGAAGKRAREDAETSSEDSLAKRLKPAEGTSKPVTLRRDRVPPPP